VAVAGENVALLLEGFDAFNSGDEARVLAFAHPEFETEVPPALSAEPDTYRGHDGIRRYFALFDDAMEDVRFELERSWETRESVVAVVRLTARGRRTGIAVEQRVAQVWTMRDGRALRVQTFPELGEALAAAALDEHDAASFDEHDPASFGERDPASLDERDPAARDEHDPAARDEHGPAARDEHDPAARDEPR
jgi:uncharacterized protein